MKYTLNNNREITYNELLANFLSAPSKELSFKQIINHMNNKNLFFDSKIIIQILNVISADEQLHYLQLFIDNCTVKKKFSLTEILEITKTISSYEQQKNTFILLLKSNFSPSLNREDIIQTMFFFEKDNISILELLLKENKVQPLLENEIREIIFSIPTNSQIDTLYCFYQYMPQIFDDLTLLILIQYFPEEKIPIIFNKLVIENNNFDEAILFKYLGTDISPNMTFNLIDLYILAKLPIYSQEKQHELFGKVKKYIIDYSDFFREPYPDGTTKYQSINTLTCNIYNFNLQNFNQLITTFGYEIFHFIDCLNIQKLLRLNQEKFNMILKLFNKQQNYLDEHTLSNILQAFYQREFLLEETDIYTTYGQFEQAIREKNAEQIVYLIHNINKKINLNNELQKYDLTTHEFIEKLLKNNNKIKEILHNITNKYIMLSREQYVNEKNKESKNELDIIKKIDKNLAKKELFIENTLEEIIHLLLSINHKKLTHEQINLLNNHELLTSLILYKINPQSYNINQENKKQLRTLEKIINILWIDNRLQIKNKDKRKYQYFTKEVTNEHLLGIMAELDIEHLEHKLLNDQRLYNELIVLFKKYKFLGWGSTFTPLEKKIDLSLNTTTISGIINYFYVIHPELKKDENPSLTKLLAYGNCYSSTSNKFAYLFGEEDYKLLCANTGNYKAPAPKSKRLELATTHLIELYQKEYVSIPSYDKKYQLPNGKIINVVVGNATSIKNLTTGERTDSCLRICGMFYELFQFIATNPNGFNIIFYNETGTFISRVSGIRNGNTVFLNELRNSLGFGINNSDLIQTIQLVTQDLIALSTNSSTPIDNVIISPDCAFEKNTDLIQYIGEDIFENSLYNLPFNYDLDGYAIYLAQRHPNCPIITNKEQEIPTYKCCDDKLLTYTDEKSASNRFIQLYIINELLSGKTIDKIELPEKKLKRCISNDKFIIAQDLNNQTFYFILNKYKNNQEIINTVNKIIENIDSTINIRRNR